MTSSLDEQRRKLEESRQRTRVFQVEQMQPNQSPEDLEFLRNLERSQRAETKLRLKGIAHLEQQAEPPETPMPGGPKIP